MTKRIAILRGINVGGKRKILMADLKKLLVEAGIQDVKTYIQSGNILFQSDVEETNTELENKIAEAIIGKYSFDVPVIVRSRKELAEIVNTNPFCQGKEQDIERLHLTFLKNKPSVENIEKASNYDNSPDKFHINNKNVFVYCSGKYHESKLTNNFFEKKLKVQATTRNWKTVLKLMELL